MCTCVCARARPRAPARACTYIMYNDSVCMGGVCTDLMLGKPVPPPPHASSASSASSASVAFTSSTDYRRGADKV
jgi:hypothetical protein